LETLFLDELGVECNRGEMKNLKERYNSADCVDRVYEYESTACIPEEEVIEEEVLR
jgi:hypothetical protein